MHTTNTTNMVTGFQGSNHLTRALGAQAEAADAALAAARAELEAAAREDISPSRAQAAQKRIAALEEECGRQLVWRSHSRFAQIA